MQKVTLTKSDIPGAKLNTPEFMKHTKYWLECQRSLMDWKANKIVEKVGVFVPLVLGA